MPGAGSAGCEANCDTGVDRPLAMFGYRDFHAESDARSAALVTTGTSSSRSCSTGALPSVIQSCPYRSATAFGGGPRSGAEFA